MEEAQVVSHVKVSLHSLTAGVDLETSACIHHKSSRYRQSCQGVMPHYWSDMPFDYLEWLAPVLPESWLISLYEQAKAQKTTHLHDDPYVRPVIRISDKIAVKCGHGVTPGEAATQQYAYQHLDRRVVRVPRVYRYFQVKSNSSWPIGYLFMEYIPGKTLEEVDLDNDDISKRLSDIVSQLASVSGGAIPGQISGGTLQGYLWGDDGTTDVFHSVDDLNHWLNRRLKLLNKEIDLRPYPLVLCHLDLCRRNIKLLDDGSLCLLDWGHSGFFPRFYEVAAAQCMNDDGAYIRSLSNAVKNKANLSEDEEKCIWLILRARAASLRYIFEPRENNLLTPADLESLPPLPPLPPVEPLPHK